MTPATCALPGCLNSLEPGSRFCTPTHRYRYHYLTKTGEIEPLPVEQETRECPVDGVNFVVPVTSKRVTCSDRCRKRLSRERD